MVANKTILISPLDWGLGHATRCMPIIDLLQQLGAKILLAGNGYSLNLLKDKYPQIPFFELPAYNIQYPVGKNAAVQTLLQSPKVLRTMKDEHLEIARIVSENKVDVIISDNRWGAWNKNCKNIFLCHQVAVLAPSPFGWMNSFLLKFHLRLIRNFDALWIPDETGENNLSGKLSHGLKIPIPYSFIGIQSRFTNLTTTTSIPATEGQYRIVALLSGAEPQRTHFEWQLKNELIKTDERILLVSGRTDKKEYTKEGKLDIVSYMQAEELLPFLQQAEIIICRAGYSTLMDLAVLGKKAILIPTPGQTEQEYLARELSQKEMAVAVLQEKFDLQAAMEKINKIKGFEKMAANKDLLLNAMEKDL